MVGGTTTDMVAYANNDVFVQIWIGAEDKLPRMIRGVYRADLAHLRHQLEFSNWQLDAAVPADAFASTQRRQCEPHPLCPSESEKSAPGAKPPAKSKPSKPRKTK